MGFSALEANRLYERASAMTEEAYLSPVGTNPVTKLTYGRVSIRDAIKARTKL